MWTVDAVINTLKELGSDAFDHADKRVEYNAAIDSAAYKLRMVRLMMINNMIVCDLLWLYVIYEVIFSHEYPWFFFVALVLAMSHFLGLPVTKTVDIVSKLLDLATKWKLRFSKWLRKDESK